MKLILVQLLLFFALTGCTIQKTMERSTASIQLNTATVEQSTQVIANNTEEVKKSTEVMRGFSQNKGFLFLVILLLLLPSLILLYFIKHFKK